MKNIYLDIDGVLLANENFAANGATEFLQAILAKYPESTYWLTTHCQGDASVPVQRLEQFFDERSVSLMDRIKPTTWKVAKTEAINFSKDFLWFDDDLYDDEREALIANSALGKWIEVDLYKDPNHLGELTKLL